MLMESFRFMTGKAFNRRGILLKYECLEVLFALNEYCNLCALASQDEPV